MATLDSKYIDVGTWQQQFELTPSYGFLASISQGEISDTPDGPANRELSILGNTDVFQISWASNLFDPSIGTLTFTLTTGDLGGGVNQIGGITVGGVTFSSSTAFYPQNGTWQWYSVADPIGTTVGANVLLTIEDTVAEPVYTLSGPTPSTIEETGATTTYEFTFEATNTPDGSKFVFLVGEDIQLDGTTTASGDVVNVAEEIEITSGTATFSLNIREDNTTEGPESYPLAIYIGTLAGPEAASTTITISDTSLSTAPVISDVTNDNDIAASVGINMAFSSFGSGGDFQVAQTDADEVPTTGWTTVSETSPYEGFTQARGTTKYYWARRAQLPGLIEEVYPANAYATTSVAETVGFVPPDRFVDPISDIQIAFSSTTATITISGTTSSSVYVARSSSGTYITQASGNTGNNITLTIPSAFLPSEGQTVAIALAAFQPEENGGNENQVLLDGDNAEVLITRDYQDATTPTTFNYTFGADADELTSVTVTVDDVDVGVVQVSDDNSTWVANGSTFARDTNTGVYERGQSYTFYARAVNGDQISSVATDTVTVSYIPPTVAEPNGLNVDNALLVGPNDTSLSITIKDHLANHAYRLSYDTVDTQAELIDTGTLESWSQNTVGQARSLTNAELPAVGGTTGFRLWAYRYPTAGGQSIYTVANSYDFDVTRTSYVPAETDVTISTNSPIQFGTTTHNVAISDNADGITVYEVWAGGYENGSALATITGNGLVTGVAGGVGTYYVTAYVPTANDGQGTGGRVELNTYTITSTAADTTPDGTPFTFDPSNNLGITAVAPSPSTWTITGIDEPVAISIATGTASSPQYKINDGSWTNQAGTVSANDVVSVRATSSGSYNTTTIMNLNVGSGTASYSLSTGDDPNAGGGGTPSGNAVYGLEIYAPDGTSKLLDTTSDVMSIAYTDVLTVPQDPGSVTVAAPGMRNTDQWHVLYRATGSYSVLVFAAVLLNLTKGTDEFTLAWDESAIPTADLDFRYWVVRKG